MLSSFWGQKVNGQGHSRKTRKTRWTHYLRKYWS